MRYIILFLAAIVTLSCESSQGLQQDVGEASVTESKEDVRGCQFVAKVTATVDLQEFDNNREAAMEFRYRILAPSFLQIDDVGKEVGAGKELSSSVLDLVLRRRAMKNLPTIVTSNAHCDEIREVR